MLVYPSPADAQVNIDYDFGVAAESRCQIAIYDMTGKRVFVERVSSVDGTLQVPVSQLAAAVYMVRMEEDGQPLQSQRLTVAH